MIVLDTHAWVWWVSGSPRLSARARGAISEHIGKEALRVSSISCWEVALLVARGRLELTMDVEDWIARSEALPFLKFLPVENRIAVRSVQLPPSVPQDPADRLIIATALSVGAQLVTKDARIQAYPEIETIW